jgi:hypothetical protein
MGKPEYEPLPLDRTGERIDEDRWYEHVSIIGDDGSWFSINDGDRLGVDTKDQMDVQFWTTWDLLIKDRSASEKPGDFRITHVETGKTLMVGDYVEEGDKRDASKRRTQ